MDDSSGSPSSPVVDAKMCFHNNVYISCILCHNGEKLLLERLTNKILKAMAQKLGVEMNGIVEKYHFDRSNYASSTWKNKY